MEKRVNWGHRLTSFDIEHINATFLRKKSNPFLNFFKPNDFFQHNFWPLADNCVKKDEANSLVRFPG